MYAPPQVLEYVLLACLALATVITFYMTMTRLIYNRVYLTYDAWIFAMCLALTLQMFENLQKK